MTIFSFSVLRYELMDSEKNGDLVLALYGILNLMPQTQAFKLLNERLKTLPREPILRQSHYIEVAQGDIFMEQNMRFGLILGRLTILKKNGGRL